ncbi:MAG TPA: phosphatidylserine decarboxylase family protein [bacterium]
MRLPIAAEGWPLILPCFAVAAVLAALHWRVAAAAALALALFVTWFFRDPVRALPADPAAIVSPADGKVVVVEAGPAGTQVSIFLSVFNVHVNRAPVAGEVVEVARHAGTFLAAWNHAASTENARASVTVRTPRGDVRFVQVTGLIARRIVCSLRPGQRVERGERYGMIRFGSRVDLFLPPGADPAVRIGDRVRGGSDIIARWRDAA